MKKLIIQKRWLIAILLALSVLLITGCSGDDGIEGSGLDISGTAATGNAIANAPLAIKSLSGLKAATTTAINGKFSISVTDDGPILLKVDAATGQSLYSIASTSGTTNIHPFTDLIIRNWFKVQGLDIDVEFASNTAISKLPSAAEVNTIKATIKKLIAPALLAFSLPEDIDLISSVFDANSIGFDRFLDFSQIVIVNNTINILLIEPETNIVNEIVTDVGLDTDFTLPDTAPPSTPEALRAFPVSISEILVVWNPSTDNINVSAYNVYRNNNLITTTPYPVFSDIGLITNTAYCYEVEAIDGAGNISSTRATMTENCPETNDTVDNSSPSIPTQLQAVEQNNGLINLAWTHDNISDVRSFNVYRGINSNINSLIATVTSTVFNDANFFASTEYCYQVTALDAADNESDRSTQICSTTGDGATSKPLSDSRLSFSVSSLQVTETQAVAVMTVNRTGDITTAISVDYASADGTATSELDYNPISGRLIWGGNDNSPRTIRAIIKPDSIVDDNESFTVSLLNYSDNAIAGDISKTTILINDAACDGLLNESVSQSMTILECTVVDGTISVSDSTLTINPGVTLIFTSGSEIDVGSTGVLSANGTADQPILFTSEQATPGYWDGIEFSSSNSLNNRLDFVTIEYGGATENDANLHMRDSGDANRIIINQSTFRNSLGYGLKFKKNTLLGQFTNNVITGNLKGPVLLLADTVGSLDNGSDYTGNTIDVINILNSRVITNQSWPATNVPYSLGSNYVDADLVIEPGATLMFRSSGELEVGPTGSLSAIGTAEQPILFTGEQKTPGFSENAGFLGWFRILQFR